MIYKFNRLEISKWAKLANLFCSIVRKLNRLKNSTSLVNECTTKLKNIMQSYDWKLERPLLRFTPALVGKLSTGSSNKIQFWCVDFNSSFQRVNFGSKIRIYIYDSVWNDRKKNRKIDFLETQCKTSLIWCQSDNTTSICFGEKSYL